MKKSLLLLFFAVIALLGFVAPAVSNQTVSAEAAGKVVFHYQKWDGNYDNVGLWAWGTGTDGTSNGVDVTGTDEFGVYFDVLIGADATEMGCIPIAAEFDNDARWNNKDTMLNEAGDGRVDILFDVTEAAGGATMHVYFFSGSDKAFVASADYANVFVVYFTATEEYEENLGLHAWGGWYNDAALGTWGTWGTPTQVFTGEFLTPEGKIGKVGMVQALVGDDEADANLIVYAGNDATKKTGDVSDVADGLGGGDVTGLYVAGDVFKGFDKVTLFADSSFAFKFIPYDNTAYTLTGTYASKPNTILVKFSADTATAFYDEAGTPIITEYQEYEVVGYEYVQKANPIVQDDTVYTAYVEEAVPANVAGRVVFHYQKWDGDYSSVGLWTWGTGTDGTQAPVEKAGVDEFGAVLVVNVDDNADDTIGLIPLAADITTDDRWASRETPDGQHIVFDVTSIKNGTTDQIDVYYFQGGLQTYFVADPTKANVLVLYMNTSGEYTETTGIHNWGWDENAAGWGEPLPMIEAFKTPDGMPGIAQLLTVSPTEIVNNPGIIVHDGDTKYSGNDNIQFQTDGTTSYFDGMVAGDVMVIYAGVAGSTPDSYSYTQVRADFVDELMNYEKGDAIWDYVTYEKTDYPRVAIDISEFFSLTKDGVAMTDPFTSVDYNMEDDAITELVLVLAADLLNASTYELTYNNGKEGIELQDATIEVNLDITAPVITFISDQEVTIVAGEGWDSALWPDMRAMDDRDGNVTDRIYVKPGDGTVDMNEVGEHIVTLTVFDTWGNESTADFTIIVTEPATGCAARNASIIGISALGLAVFFVTRKRWL
ncbi:MAG: hypothetical protein KKE16_05640 [Firmicutes bacterium]|nr:hypothetical protein [Bacillota bacterium]